MGIELLEYFVYRASTVRCNPTTTGDAYSVVLSIVFHGSKPYCKPFAIECAFAERYVSQFTMILSYWKRGESGSLKVHVLALAD